MTRDRWHLLRVDLVDGPIEIDRPPGRDFVIGGDHTFGDLADAIDTAFARWDRGHLHEFTLADGRRIGMPDPDDEGVIDEESEAVAALVRPGDVFTYVFDLGDNWEHRCRLMRSDVDPEEEAGEVPLEPVPVMGWGAIPDQYGREAPDDA
ncbi:MAG: IS1096 element passenger TnpR family protein [Acidimicrobiia bacterium]